MIDRCATALVIIALLVARSAMAGATHDSAAAIAEATAAFTDLRYDEALRLLDRAWRRGDNAPDQIEQIFTLAGQAAGSIGDDDNARLWFSRWLCLDPRAELPAGTSPKLTALLGDARVALAGAALTARAAARDRSTIVTVTSDPLALVDAARAGDVRTPLHDHSATLPASGDTIELLDRHGNVLVRIVAVPPPIAVVTPRPSRPWFARWSTWAIASGGLALVSGAALWVAVDARSSIRDLNRDSANHEFSEARTLERRFDAAQLTAGIAIGGSLATAIVSGVLGIRGDSEPAQIVPTGDGVSIVWSGSF